MGSACCFTHKNKEIINVGVKLKKGLLENQTFNCTSSILPNRFSSKRSSIYLPNNEDILNKYNFEEPIGAGYFGTVKICTPKNDSQKKYACKSIDKKKLTMEKINNLMREIETLSMVDHPNIIKYFETYSDNRYFHIVMELCTGGELFERLTNAKFLDEKEVCNIVFKICSAILHCHSLNIVHRDLKPENILYENKSAFSDIKIIDFGLSRQKMIDEDLKSIVGSPFYVAPEVLDGHYDKKCDIWSIGVLTYVLLSGKPPFLGADNNDLYDKIKNDTLKFKGKVWDSISNDAKDFIKLLLQKKSSKRPNAKDMMEAKWFKQIFKDDLSMTMLNPNILEKLKKYHQPKKFVKTVLNFMIKNLNGNYIDNLKMGFNILDKNRTGFIDFAQLKNAFTHCNISVNDDELKAIMENCNPFWKQKLNYSSFITAAIDTKVLIDNNILWDTFKTLDTEQRGFISISTLERALERTGKTKKRNSEFMKMFEELGLGKDDVINYDQFRDIMRSNL